VVNKINLLHKPLLRYQYLNDGIKSKKWYFFDFGITTCKTTKKWQKEGQFTTPVPVEPNCYQSLFLQNHSRIRFASFSPRSQALPGNAYLKALPFLDQRRYCHQSF